MLWSNSDVATLQSGVITLNSAGQCNVVADVAVDDQIYLLLGTKFLSLLPRTIQSPTVVPKT